MSDKQFEDPQALAQQLMQAANSLTDEEASQRYQQILAQLPPDQASELNTLALSQVQSGDRRQLAAQFRQAHQDPNSPFDGYDYDDDDQAAQPTSLGRMSLRAQQQDPSLFGGMLGNSGIGGQIGKAALAALAAMLLRQVMNNQGQAQNQGMPAGGGLGSILGGLLGGGTMGGSGGQQMPQGNDPLGSILGGLLGGAIGGQSVPQQRQPAPQGGDLGSILGGLLGGGASTQHMPQSGGTDLGSILGSILGGGNAQPTQQPRGTSGSHRKEGLRVGGEE